MPSECVTVLSVWIEHTLYIASDTNRVRNVYGHLIESTIVIWWPNKDFVCCSNRYNRTIYYVFTQRLIHCKLHIIQYTMYIIHVSCNLVFILDESANFLFLLQIKLKIFLTRTFSPLFLFVESHFLSQIFPDLSRIKSHQIQTNSETVIKSCYM